MQHGSKKNRLAARGLALALGSLSLLLAACDDSATPLSSDVASAAVTHDAAAGTGQQLARAIAAALRNPAVRASVRNALRDSRANEHKLVLQEFAATQAGRQLVDAAARSAGVDAATVRGWISSLPAMDFYVPVPQHRRAWRATDDVVVGLNASVDDTRLTGYAPDGTVHQLDAKNGVPSRTVILIAPAEPKVQVAAVTSGDVIEPNAPDERPAYSVSVTGGARLSVGATYTGGVIYGWKNYLPDGWGAVELMVKSYNVKGGTRLAEEIMSEGSGCLGTGAGWCNPEWSYPQREINMGAAIVGTTWLKVWERDSGLQESGDDDFWGEQSFGGYGEAKLHRFWTGCTVAGPDSSQYCASWDPNWMFYSTPSVDIVFYHATNGSYDIT